MLKNLVGGLTDDQLKLFIALAGGFCLILGTLITGIFGVVIARWNRNSLATAEIRKLAIEAALDNWRADVARTHETNKTSVLYSVERPEGYFAEMFELMDIASDAGKSLKEAAALLRQR